MRIEDNLMLATVQEVVEYIGMELGKRNRFKNWKEYFGQTSKPFMDFAKFEVCDPTMNLREMYAQCDGWYGIRSIDSGHDSNDIVLIADYYGGGSATLFSIYEELEQKETEEGIKNMILDCMFGGIEENFLLFCEFYTD